MFKVIIGGIVGAAAGYYLYDLEASKHQACYVANHKTFPGTIITLPGTPAPEQVDAQCDQASALSFLKSNSQLTMGGFALLGALAGYALK